MGFRGGKYVWEGGERRTSRGEHVAMSLEPPQVLGMYGKYPFFLKV